MSLLEYHGMTDKERRLKKKKEEIDHPSHYNEHPSGIECIDIVEHMSFNIGNAVKYLWRCELKHVNPFKCLGKAVWYTQRELQRLEQLNDLGYSFLYDQYDHKIERADIIKYMPLNIGEAVEYLWRIELNDVDPFKYLRATINCIDSEIKRLKDNEKVQTE